MATTARAVRQSELSLEADLLVVACRRAHVAERQAVLDESGPPAALAAVEHDNVLAD